MLASGPAGPSACRAARGTPATRQQTSCVSPMRRAISACDGRRADADREVEALLDEVDHAIRKLDVEAKLRMLRAERRDRGRDVPLAERDRAGQLAACRAAPARST